MKTVLLWMSIHLLVQKKMKTRTHIYHLQMRTIKLIVCHTTLRRWWSYMFHRHTWRLHLIRSVNVVAPLSHSLTKPHRDPVQNLQLNAIIFCSQWVKHSQKLSLANPNLSVAHMTQTEFGTKLMKCHDCHNHFWQVTKPFLDLKNPKKKHG